MRFKIPAGKNGSALPSIRGLFATLPKLRLSAPDEPDRALVSRGRPSKFLREIERNLDLPEGTYRREDYDGA